MLKDKTIKILMLLVFVFMAGCSVPTVPMASLAAQPALPGQDVSSVALDKRMVFNDFLASLRTLIAKSYDSKPLPKVFISYAWEDERSPEGKADNKKLQERLMMLQEDLESLGIETFIDMKYMQGNMRQTMKQHLTDADFVIVAGTPRFKKKATQDRLSLLSYFDPRSIPKRGNHVILVEGRDAYTVYYLEEGEIKDIMMMPFTQLEQLSEITWMQKPNGIKEALLSEQTNQVLERLFARLKRREGKWVSNVQFELGIALDKAQQKPKTLMPLIMKGEYAESFPGVMQSNLIRDFRSEENYYAQMSNLSNPLGIIAAICPTLIKNKDYASAVNDLKKALK